MSEVHSLFADLAASLKAGLMQSRSVRLTFALTFIIAVAGCGSSPTTPATATPATITTPTPPIAPIAPGSFSVTSVAISPYISSIVPNLRVAFIERPIVFSWATVSGATSYVLEIGTSSGAANVLSMESPTPSFTWAQLAMGTFFTRVRAKNGVVVGFPSAELQLGTISLKDYTEALFLGTGPVAESPQQGCPAGPGTMAGWPSGDTVTITMSTTMNSIQQASLRAAVGSAAVAMLGAINTSVGTTASSAPSPQTDEIVSAIGIPPVAGASGYSQWSFRAPGVFRIGSITNIPTTNGGAFGHEAGHSLYGFCHVNVNTAAEYISVMSYFNDDDVGLSEADIAATQAVYGAGLRGGATRSAFIAAGVINITPTPIASARRIR